MYRHYSVLGFSLGRNKWTVHVHLPGARTVELPLPPVSARHPGPHIPYARVSHAHVVDSDGFGVYPPRKYRPFVPLPDGTRPASQCEFDHWCAENPSGPSDLNAAVWNAVAAISLVGRQFVDAAIRGAVSLVATRQKDAKEKEIAAM